MQNSKNLKKDRYDLLMKQRLIMERAGNRQLNSDEESEYSKMNDAVEELDKRIKRLEDLEKKEEDDKPEDDEDKKDEDREGDDDDDKEESKRFAELKHDTRHGRMFGEWRSFKSGKGERDGSKEYKLAYDRFLRTGKIDPEFRDLSLTGGDGAGSLVTPTAISKDFVNFLNSYTFVRNLANIQYVNDAAVVGQSTSFDGHCRRRLDGRSSRFGHRQRYVDGNGSSGLDSGYADQTCEGVYP